MLRAVALLLLAAAAAPAVEPAVVATAGSDRFRFPGGVQELVVSPDGRRVLAFNPAAVRVYDAATGRPIGRGVSSPPADIMAVGFAGDHVLTLHDLPVGDCYSVRRYDPAFERPIQETELRMPAPLETAFSPDGRLLAVAFPRRVVLYDTHTGREVNRVLPPRRSETVADIRFSADGRRLAVVGVVGGGNTIRVYDRTSGRELAVLKLKGALTEFALAPDGNRVAAALDGGNLTTLDVLTGGRKTWETTEPVNELFDLGGGRVMAVDAAGSKCRVFDAATGKAVRQFAVPTGTEMSLVNGTVVAPDGRTLYSTSDSGGITAWDLTTVRRLPQSADDVPLEAVVRFHGPTRVALAPRTGRLGEGLTPTAVWDLTTGGRRVFPAEGELTDLSAGGLWRASATGSRLTVTNTATGKVARTLPLPADAQVQGVWFRRGDAEVCVDTSDAVLVWTLATNRVRRVAVVSHTDRLPSVPSAGRWFATWAKLPTDELDRSCVLRLFDLDGTRPPSDIACRVGDRLQFTPDGSRLVRVCDGAAEYITPATVVETYDPAAGRLLRTVRVSGSEVQAISPDGRTLLLSTWREEGVGQTTVLTAVELATGRERWRLPPVRDWLLTGAGFSPDGRRVAVATTDGFLRVWAVADDAPPAATAWDDLTGPDAAKAFAAVEAFGRSPDVAVSLLKANVSPAAAIDPKAVRGWLADLDSPSFAVRRNATRNLRPVTPTARPAMEALLQATASPEVRERLTELLTAAVRPTPAAVRAVRAAEVLERVGTAEAVALLRTWAAGAEGATLTVESQGALSRLHPR